ncbi:hypothetical protein A3715_18810 [Oleiphilus sp. HI0009]|nr:hypothetical protein A3715_19255 [Oleiphilus sp. HI0009]KZX81845.1 hypothetical protein A3715_18810 [Oleiphilus sp. HI0009]
MQFLIVFMMLGLFLYVGIITWDDVLVYGSWLVGGTGLGVLMCWIGFSFSEVAKQKEEQRK